MPSFYSYLLSRTAPLITMIGLRPETPLAAEKNHATASTSRAPVAVCLAMVSLLTACNATTPTQTVSADGKQPNGNTAESNESDQGNDKERRLTEKEASSASSLASQQTKNKDTHSHSESTLSTSPLPSKSNNLWERIRKDYQLQHQHIPSAGQQRIDGYIARYSRHPKSMLRQTERAGLYLYHVVTELEKHKLPAELALLPFVESSYDPFAYSSGRASGLWQFIPGTGERFKLHENWWVDERRDVVESTEAAIKYFKYLYKHFDNDWLLAIAAYNAGEGTVGRAIRRNKKQGKPTDYWSLPLPKETINYLPKLFAWSEMILNPAAYQLRLANIKNRPYFASVNVGSQIDLAKLATMADISIDDLYALNPAFNRWATDPAAPHHVLVPVNKASTLKAELAKHPLSERVQWKRYTIRSNDSLSVIASRFNTTVSALRSVNQLKSNRIQIGRTLLIPSASQSESYYSSSSQQRLFKRQKSSSGKNKHRIEHQVKSGETLWSIAKQYSVSSRNIAHWNNMSERDVLRNQQRLVIWSKEAPKANTQASQTRADAVVRELTYKVRSGDSLSTIAHKFNVTINKIQRWNKIKPQKPIQPGQKLTLFVSIADQAKRF